MNKEDLGLPLVIKRYSNRKLYNTQAARYLTLKQVAEVVCQGVEIQVIDQANGDDITAVVLAQIIQEQEKEHTGIFPVSLLASIVHSQGDLLQVGRRLFGSLPVLECYLSDEFERRVGILIESGELTKEEGKRLIQKMSAFTQPEGQPEQWFDRWVNKYLEKFGLASVSDYERLSTRLDELDRQVNDLFTNQTKSQP